MSRIIKGESDTQRIEFVMNNRKYILDVTRICNMTIMRGSVSLDMECSGIDCQPCNSDFMEDVRSLAKQYGLKIDSIEVSSNNN